MLNAADMRTFQEWRPGTAGMLLAGVFVVLAAVWDLRTQRIPYRLLVPSLGIAVLYGICLLAAGGETVPGLLLSLFPGALLLGLSVLSPGSVGSGDGICFLTAGLLTGAGTCMLLLCGSLLLTGITGGIGLVTHRASGRSKLPLMPFCIPIYVVLLIVRLRDGGF